MTVAIEQFLIEAEVVPDATGALRFGFTLGRPPIDAEDLLSRWRDLAGADAQVRLEALAKRRLKVESPAESKAGIRRARGLLRPG